MWLAMFPLFLVSSTSAQLAFLVTFPAVNPGGSTAKLCASLVYPNETLHMSIHLEGKEQNSLLEVVTDTALHRCISFQTPVVQEDSVQTIRVVVEGQAFVMVKESKIMFRPVHPVIILQTDKPVYKPGQTVNFTLVAVDHQLVPVNVTYDSVRLQDPNSNIMNQWSNISSEASIVQLSHPLSSEASLGTYSLLVLVGQQSSEQNFRVMEYVLPRFNVELSLPSEAHVADAQVITNVCATYTYGQSVLGIAKMELCRGLHYKIPALPTAELRECAIQDVYLNKTGCAAGIFNMSDFLNVGVGFDDHLVLNVTVQEEGTAVKVAIMGKISLNYTIGTVSFINSPRSGHGSIIARYYNNSPIAWTPVYLYKDSWKESHLLLIVTTNQAGVASFPAILVSESDYMHIVASLYPPNNTTRFISQTLTYQDDVLSISQLQNFGSALNSLSVKAANRPFPCGTAVDVHVQYTVVWGKDWPDLDLIFLALSSGAIVFSAQSNVTLRSVVTGEAVFQLEIQPEMAPVVQVLAYMVLPTDVVLAASMDFPTGKCFRNPVSLRFSLSKAVPGEKTVLQVAAQPGSLCALAIVAQSVSAKRLNADTLFNMLHEAPDIPSAVKDLEACLNKMTNGSRIGLQGHNLPTFFESLGLKVTTNLPIELPSCMLLPEQRYQNHMYISGPIRKSNLVTKRTKVLGNLPDVDGVWKLVTVGSTGSTLVPLTVPDTITTWEAEAFCLSQEGLGVAPAVQLTVFKPFFLDMTMPYSIVLGEHFVLRATVYNNLTNCIRVKVMAHSSANYILKPCPGCVYKTCVCAKKAKSFSWNLTPSAIGSLNVTLSAQAVHSLHLCNKKLAHVPKRGQIDTVTKTLLVKAEGLRVVQTQTWFLCPKNSPLRQKGILRLPANALNGSAIASFSVTGDLLGQAVNNMSSLCFDVYVLDYLQATGQLTPAILEKALSVLKTGYQDQLSSKGCDGGFSPFGNGDTSIWLTASVFKCLSKAQSFIYVDPHVLKQAAAWMLTTKKVDGCFQMVGRLYHNDKKGGIHDDVTLTAYVTTAMLESGYAPSLINDSLAYLWSDTSYLNNTYIAALLAYTFSLAGDVGKTSELLQHLKLIAINKNGFIHWSQSSLVTSMALSVEISAYVLLAILTPSPVSTADLGYASSIVRWLVQLENPYGDFYSTEDTVVALQALALYATLVYGPLGSSTVTLQSAHGLYSFAVNTDKRLVYQAVVLKDTEGKYNAVVSGTACVYGQVTLRYNIPLPTFGSSFNICANRTSVCRSGQQGEVLTLDLTVQYNGPRHCTNTIQMDINLLSGFIPDHHSIEKIRADWLVDRVETPQDHVIMYLRELTVNTTFHYTVRLLQEVQVGNLKSAVIKIFDYYQTNDVALITYTSPCAIGND